MVWSAVFGKDIVEIRLKKPTPNWPRCENPSNQSSPINVNYRTTADKIITQTIKEEVFGCLEKVEIASNFKQHQTR